MYTITAKYIMRDGTSYKIICYHPSHSPSLTLAYVKDGEYIRKIHLDNYICEKEFMSDNIPVLYQALVNDNIFMDVIYETDYCLLIRNESSLSILKKEGEISKYHLNSNLNYIDEL